MRRQYLPLAAFAIVIALLGVSLTLNPRLVPSPLIGESTPEFRLPRLRNPSQSLSRTDLVGQVSLLNVWATWCVGCREEHPLLVRIAGTGDVPIFGLNYKDQYRAALRWLDRFGDPYRASGYDADGRVGIDLGVYGLPETFIVDRDGTIAYKHIGPITEAAWRDQLLPVIEGLKQR